jgi:hypothetical protein
MQFDSAAAVTFIDEARWRFAKTMPDWPHEYTVKAWRPESSATFEAFCQHILDEGVVHPWPPPPAEPIYHNHYLVIGEHRYWAMGPRGDSDPVSDKTVINRAASRELSGQSRSAGRCQGSARC